MQANDSSIFSCEDQQLLDFRKVVKCSNSTLTKLGDLPVHQRTCLCASLCAVALPVPPKGLDRCKCGPEPIKPDGRFRLNKRKPDPAISKRSQASFWLPE